MRPAMIIGKGEAVSQDIVAQAAQFVDAGTRANDVQLADSGEGIDWAGVQALQKASALSRSVGILYVSVFVAGLLVGHFFGCHLGHRSAFGDAVIHPAVNLSLDPHNALRPQYDLFGEVVGGNAAVDLGTGKAGDAFHFLALDELDRWFITSD
jgi:hypothetical protein